MNTVLRTIATAIAVAVAVWLVPGIRLTSDDLVQQGIALVGVALLIGVVNGVVKPFAKAVGFCFIVLTLGLFLFVINALMLMLASWLAGVMGLAFHVDGFWPALWGSIIISLVAALVGGVLGVENKGK